MRAGSARFPASTARALRRPVIPRDKVPSSKQRAAKLRLTRTAKAAVAFSITLFVGWNLLNLGWFLLSGEDDALRAAVGGPATYTGPSGLRSEGVLREARFVFSRGRVRLYVLLAGRRARGDGAIQSFQRHLHLDPWEMARLTPAAAPKTRLRGHGGCGDMNRKSSRTSGRKRFVSPETCLTPRRQANNLSASVLERLTGFRGSVS